MIALLEVALALALAAQSPQELLQRELDRWRAEVRAPGAIAAIVRMPEDADAKEEKRVELVVASGLARKEPATPMKTTDRIFSGSIGKTFVAAIALQLVDEGKLELDAKLPTWFGPEARIDGKPLPPAQLAEDAAWFPRLPHHDAITLRQLLNHTSGLREYFSQPAAIEKLRAQPQAEWTPHERVAFVVDQAPLFAPGSGWSYADTNYIVVGMVIERVAGRAFYDECRERLLEPLELAFTEPATKPALKDLVSGYTTPNRPFPFPEEVAAGGVYCANPQFEWTGGGFISNPLDLARYAAKLYGSDDVVPPELRMQMVDGVAAQLTPGETYGLGCEIRDTRLGRAIGHSGWFPGYLSDVFWFEGPRLAVAVQCNTDRGIGLARQHAFLDAAASAAAAAFGDYADPVPREQNK